MSEEYEPILRTIARYEDRIRKREDTIKYLETILEVRREELGLSHIETFRIDTTYRSTVYSIRALRGWQTRDRKVIEKLKIKLPPYEYTKIIITFSIETGRGHEPFYAEVHVSTVLPVEQPIPYDRIMNATVKLFWIIFDANKCVTTEKRELWGKETYEAVRRRKNFFLYQIVKTLSPNEVGIFEEVIEANPYEAYEYAMDNFILGLKILGCFERNLDEFATRQAIIKIGVEPPIIATEDDKPMYPRLYLLIEKGKSKSSKSDWILGARILVSPTTDVDIMELLDMGGER